MASIIDQLRNRLTTDQNDLEKDIDVIIKDLEKFLSKNLPRILADSLKGQADPVFLINSLIDNFKNAGLSSQLSNIAELYGKELRRAQETAVAEGWITKEKFQTVINLDTIESLIRFRVEDIQNKSVQTIGRLRPIILENVILGTTPDLPALTETATSALLSYTKTELNTSLLAFNRTISIVQAEQLEMDYFIYVGPYDKSTRPFCSKVLTSKSPPIYSMAEIKKMRNDQGLPVEIYAGGYNCRHKWYPVSKSKADEIKKEWGTDNYVDGGEGQ